jgi:predicted alpha/beta hydrolase family esterase
MPFRSSHRPVSSPLILALTDAEDAAPGDWLTLWGKERENYLPTSLGRTDPPGRNAWVTALGAAIARADRPVILVARGLACHAVAWWAAMERPSYGAPVAGALLVAPPNVDTANTGLRLAEFGPAPKVLLPFPSVVIASRNDPQMDFAGASKLSGFWGSHCIDGGEIGTAGPEADLGSWDHGRHALDWLVAAAGDHARALAGPIRTDNVVPLRSPHAYGNDLSL